MDILDGNTYRRWHEIYVRSSNEKGLVPKALKKVFQAMPSRKSFLDIGAGGGDLTLKIKPFFKTTVVVEPNKCVKDIFKKHNIEFVSKPFEKADLEKRKFDFILCSHVFWLIKKSKREAFIRKMYSHLSKCGKMAIIMMSPIGRCHEFHEKFFYNYDTNTHELLKHLHVIGLPTTAIPISVEFKTKKFEDFYSICKLFTAQSWLHPVNISNKHLRQELGDLGKYTETKFTEIKNYINANCFRNNTYSMKMELDILLVKNENQKA